MQQEIKVLVPEDRVPDFYTWFGAWLAGASHPEGNAVAPAVEVTSAAQEKKTHWSNTPEDLELAIELWQKMSGRARRLFGYLMERPGEKFNGQELATALEIPNGVYGIAGVLAWPGGYWLPMRKHLPIRYDAAGGRYWMTPETVELFKEAKGDK